MLSAFLFNLLASFIAVSISGSIVMHDTHLDKAFMSSVTPASDTSVREFGHSVMGEQHTHSSSHASVSNLSATDPLLANRSNRKHVNLQHVRLRLSSLLS